MSDQPTDTPPAAVSAPPMPDRSPAPPAAGTERATIRTSAAVVLTAASLMIGGVIGAGVGTLPASQAHHEAVELGNHNAELTDQIAVLKAQAEDRQTTISNLQAQVKELQEAPELLAAQTAEREARQAEQEQLDAEQAAAQKKAEQEKAAKQKREAEQAARTFPGEGTFVVGEDIKPGTYKSSAGSDGGCYWARLSGTTGDYGELIANHFTEGPTTVSILPTDVAFETSGCTEWERQD